MRNKNVITIKENHAEIKTAKGGIILIDVSDAKSCKEHSWYIDDKGYPSTCYKGKTTRLHRFLIGETNGLQVDHINRNKLDNRRCNLRLVTNQQNQFNQGISKNNTSSVKGVYYNKQCKKWCCQITFNRKKVYSKLFETFEEAVKQRKILESKYFKINKVN